MFVLSYQVYVSNPDGSPAAGIPVQFSANDDKSDKTTLSNGMAKLTLNTLSTTTSLEIQVKLPGLQQKFV